MTEPTSPQPAGTALSNAQIVRAAAVVLLGFLAGGFLGLIRTAAFSAVFGASDALDAFYAAQRIPEALFTLVAGGALGSSFIPVFSRFIAADDADGAWRLASAAMSLVGLAALALALLMTVFAPQIVPVLLVPGATAEAAALTTGLTQTLMITVVIFSLSGLLMGILNARQIFNLPALAISFNNLGQIVGALVLTQWFGVYGLAYGAILGAALHLLIQIPGLRRARARLTFLPDPRVPGVREVVTLMIPRVIGLGVVQINFIVNTALTSGMIDGSRTALVSAWTVMFFALGVIAQSVGTALFPSLAALAAAGDLDGFRDRLAHGLRGVLFLAFPASIALIALGEPAVRLMFERGAWTAEHTRATAWALSFFAAGIAGHSLLEVLSRAFYALSDTITPVAVGVGSIVLNIILSLILIRVLGAPDDLSRGPFAGLALANTIATLLEAGALWLLLRRRIGSIRDRFVMSGAARALAAAIAMGAALALAVGLLQSNLTDAPSIIVLIVGLGIGGAVFFAASAFFGLEEAVTIPRLALRRLRR